jgi:hypothetical protein
MLKRSAPQLAFLGLVSAALVSGAGGPLQYVYPLAAIFTAIVLERRTVAAYVSFALWLWLLTPFVRRVVDFQSGWHEPSFILLTPYLVTGWPPVRDALAAAIRSLRVMPRLTGGGVFALAGAGAGLGIPLGFMASPSAATVETLNWLVPIAFGGYLAARATDLDTIERAVTRTLLQAAVVVGAYAIYQYNVAPAWDAEWMRNTEANSFGQARPFEIRVFSTAHSPGVMACFIVVPIVLWAAKPRLWGFPSAALAAVALALSQVRTAWLALFIAVVLVERRVGMRERLRLAGFLSAAALCAAPFVLPIEVSDVTWTRFLTIFDLGRDDSALSRFEGHRVLLDVIGAHPFGLGLGIGDPRLAQVIGSRDSIIVAALVQFGLLGAAVYLVGLIALFGRMLRYYRSATTSAALGLSAVGLGLLCVGVFGTVTAGPLGIFTWTIGGLATAGLRQQSAQPARAAARTPVIASPGLRPIVALGGPE